MKNYMPFQTEDINNCKNEVDQPKKTWSAPMVTEISRFSILGGLDNTKTGEAANGSVYIS
jgi:hypothetical protein